MLVNDPADEVCRERFVDLLRVGQAQVSHELDEFRLRLGQSRVGALFLADSRSPPPFVVVRRINYRVVG